MHMAEAIRRHRRLLAACVRTRSSDTGIGGGTWPPARSNTGMWRLTAARADDRWMQTNAMQASTTMQTMATVRPPSSGGDSTAIATDTNSATTALQNA